MHLRTLYLSLVVLAVCGCDDAPCSSAADMAGCVGSGSGSGGGDGAADAALPEPAQAPDCPDECEPILIHDFVAEPAEPLGEWAIVLPVDGPLAADVRVDLGQPPNSVRLTIRTEGGGQILAISELAADGVDFYVARTAGVAGDTIWYLNGQLGLSGSGEEGVSNGIMRDLPALVRAVSPNAMPFSLYGL